MRQTTLQDLAIGNKTETLVFEIFEMDIMFSKYCCLMLAMLLLPACFQNS